LKEGKEECPQECTSMSFICFFSLFSTDLISLQDYMHQGACAAGYNRQNSAYGDEASAHPGALTYCWTAVVHSNVISYIMIFFCMLSSSRTAGKQ
jgi:hypothetical protein